MNPGEEPMALAGPSGSTPPEDRPELRYSSYIVKEGHLLKKGKVRGGTIFGLHKKHRYLKLNGSVLQCWKKETDEYPEWEYGLQNTHVTGDEERMEIEIKGHRTEHFIAETKEQYLDWLLPLKSASEKSIKDYYGFIKSLGEGHFGRVLLAKDRRTKEKFAVKVIRKDRTELRNQTLIQREMDILRLVNHKNIVRLYDLFETDDKLYFVLEYMPGGALYEVLAKGEIHFSEERASHILKDVLEGLVYLHEKGIVHRDVKPDNLLTTSKEWPFTTKLADFGLSNFMLNNEPLESKVGTPFFTSREVITSEKYGTKADLWSLGVVAYEMLSGRKPFEGTHTKSVLYAILDGHYSFPERQWKNISAEARDFVSKLICQDVDRRLSAEEALVHPWIVNEGRNDPLAHDVQQLAAGANRMSVTTEDEGEDEIEDE